MCKHQPTSTLGWDIKTHAKKYSSIGWSFWKNTFTWKYVYTHVTHTHTHNKHF